MNTNALKKYTTETAMFVVSWEVIVILTQKKLPQQPILLAIPVVYDTFSKVLFTRMRQSKV